MVDFDKVPLPDYTRLEDGLNSATHAVGVPMTMVFAFMLLKKADFHPDAVHLIATIVYCISMLILYFGSAYYHGLKPSHIKRVARVLDHSNIFFMMAGSLSAFYLIGVYNFNKWLAIGLTIASWVVSAIGITLTVIDQEKFKKVQMAMYLCLGWSALIGAFVLLKNGGDAEKNFEWMIVIGGAVYTVGAILYGVGKKVRYIHCVFHIFILAGTIIQFIGIYNNF